MDISARFSEVSISLEVVTKNASVANTQAVEAPQTSTSNSLKESRDTFEKSLLDKTLQRLKAIKKESSDILLEALDKGDSKTVYVENIRQTVIDLEITATDGNFNSEILINISESLLRKIGIYEDKELEKTKLIDPLVVNFDGKGAELSDQKFTFDLDSDGRSDQISLLKRGSGFLALDRDGNGKIDDGSELFGTKSGDGFLDLSMYDTNKDGKIDTEDFIYDKLRIWKKNDNGEDSLIGLGEAGVGVIYLNAFKTQEALYDGKGNLAGMLQKSAAIDFTDDRFSGGIYHIDMAAG